MRDYPLRDGLPHSETAGSRDYNSSPTTIVVIYVLPRHEYPRHPLSTCSVAENKGVVQRTTFVLYQRNFTPIFIGVHVRVYITPYDATTYIINYSISNLQYKEFHLTVDFFNC